MDFFAPIITIGFVNWDDDQLSEIATVEGFGVVFFFLPSPVLHLRAWFRFAYYLRHDRESVQNTEGGSSNNLKSFVCLFK